MGYRKTDIATRWIVPGSKGLLRRTRTEFPYTRNVPSRERCRQSSETVELKSLGTPVRLAARVRILALFHGRPAPYATARGKEISYPSEFTHMSA